jgi:nucleoside-diphosphate-sugar epimerase
MLYRINMKKKVFIIGNLGYVGIPLVKLLKKENLYTVGLDTNWFYLNDYSYYDYSNFPNIQLFEDVRNFKLSNLDFVPDIIIYLAAVSNDPMGKKFKFATKKINYEACINIAKQAKKIKVKKFIFASSCSLYGAADNSNPRKESDKLNPLTDYAKSKAMSEIKLQKLSSSSFKVICLRFATAAGYSDNLRLDLVFNDFVANSVCKGKIELLSSGTSWRPLIHVSDMAKAMVWASKFNLKNHFLVLNVGSNKWNFKIIDLAKQIGKIIGDKVKIKVKNKSFIDKRSYKVDFSLFNKLAGKYKPSINFKKAVLELKLFCEDNRKKLINFRNNEKWARQINLDYLIKKGKLDHKLMWKKK